MERDKRGRFVKKAQLGSEISYNGKRYRLKNGITMQPGISALMNANIENIPAYEKYLNDYYEPVEITPTGSGNITNPPQIQATTPTQEVVPETYSTEANTPATTFSLNNVTKPKGFYAVPKAPELKLNAGLKINSANTGLGGNISLLGNSKPIKYGYKDGQIIDEFGATLSLLNIDDRYVYSPELTNSLTGTDVKTNALSGMQVVSKPNDEEVTTPDEVSAGFKTVVSPNGRNGKNGFNWQGLLNKNKLADFLDWTRAGIGIAVNNKIAERALEAEKPFLKDV